MLASTTFKRVRPTSDTSFIAEILNCVWWNTKNALSGGTETGVTSDGAEWKQ